MNADDFILGLSAFLSHFTQNRSATIRSPQLPNRAKVRELKSCRRLLIQLARLSECKVLLCACPGRLIFLLWLGF
jgi:hypothetical protein